MNELLDRFKHLPRWKLQQELRRITGDSALYLWEYLPYGYFYAPVQAGPLTAAALGVPPGTVIGYHVPEGGGEVKGGALADLMNAVNQDAPPYPDPFL